MDSVAHWRQCRNCVRIRNSDVSYCMKKFVVGSLDSSVAIGVNRVAQYYVVSKYLKNMFLIQIKY